MPPPSLWYSDSWHVTYSYLLWFIPLSEAKRGHLRNLSDDDGGNIKRVRSFGIRSDPCSPCQWNWKHRNGKYLDYPRHGIVNENFLWKLSIHFQFSYSMKFCSVWKTKSWLSEWKKMENVKSNQWPVSFVWDVFKKYYVHFWGEIFPNTKISFFLSPPFKGLWLAIYCQLKKKLIKRAMEN